MIFQSISQLALELANDQHHNAALGHWKQVKKSPLQLVTTSYVFDEIVTFFKLPWLSHQSH